MQKTERKRLRVWQPVGLLVIAFALMVIALSAQAQPPGFGPGCHPHADVVRQLDQKYSEAVAAIGLQSNGQLVEVFATANGETWTLILTRPDGRSCIMAAGKHWEFLPPKNRDQRASLERGGPVDLRTMTAGAVP